MPGISVTDTYDALLSTTLKNYSKKLRDNIFNAFPFLKWLLAKGRVQHEDGGSHIVEHLLYGKNTTFKFFAGYEGQDTTPQEGVTIALYDWKELGGTITISRAEMRKNSGKHRLLNLLEVKTKQAELSARDIMTEKIFANISSEPTKNPTGIFLIVSNTPSTTTVGSLSGVTYAWWRNHQADVGAYATNLESKMRTAYNTVSAGGVNFPNLILCTQTAYEYYEALGVDLKRFVNEKATLDLGFEVLRYKGADMFWDAGMASGVPVTGETMLFLNSENIRMVMDQESDFVTTDFIEPVDQFCKVAKVCAMGNLTCNNRKRLGILHGIDAT